MNSMAPLTSALLDLLKELEGHDVPLILGRGYGIYLRYQRIGREGRTTMFRELPEPRSTNDMDLFLRAELLLDSARLKPLRSALTTLGYDVVPGAEHYQFVRPGPGIDKEKGIKIDVLTGPTQPFAGTPVKFDARRVKPKPPIDLHAHPCEEAIALTEGAEQCPVTGTKSDGQAYAGQVWLPHPFTFITMKLFALRDRIDDAGKDFGRHHALDLYTVVGSMSPEEWDSCLHLCREHAADRVVAECRRITAELFAGLDARGTIRLRESAYFRPAFQVPDFIEALHELFAAE